MSTLNVDGATQAAAVEPAHRHNQIIVRGQTVDVQRPLLERLHPCRHDHEVIVAFVSSGKISISRHMPDEPVCIEASSFLVGGRRTRLIEGPSVLKFRCWTSPMRPASRSGNSYPSAASALLASRQRQ